MPTPSGDIIMKKPSGKLVAVSQENLAMAKERGYVEAPQEDLNLLQKEREHGAEDLLTFAERAVGSATFGGSDWLARQLAPDYADDMQARAEVNTAASTIGNIAGAVAPALLSGGTSLLARGASVIPSGALARMSAKIAAQEFGEKALTKGASKLISQGIAGALEAGAHGAGQYISDTSLKGQEFSAQALAGTSAMAALTGGIAAPAIGLAGSLASKGAGSLARKVMGGASKEATEAGLEGVANRSALKAFLGQNKKAFKTLSEGKRGVSKVDASKWLRDHGIVDGLPSRTGMAERTANKLGELQSQLDDMVKRLDGSGDSGIRAADVADSIKKKIGEEFSTAAEKDIKHQIESYLGDLVDQYGDEPISFANAAKERGAVQARVFRAGNPDARTKLAHKEAGRIWNEIIDEKANKLLPGHGLGDEYKKIRKEYSTGKTLFDFVEDRLQGDQANRLLSMSDHQIGVGAGVAGAMARGAVGDVTGLAMSALQGVAAAVTNKGIREYGNTVSYNVANQLSRMKAMNSSVANITSKINDSVSRFYAETPGTTARVVGIGAARSLIKSSDIADKIDRIRLMAENPEKLQEAIVHQTTGLADLDPDMATGVGETLARGAGHLAANLPQPINGHEEMYAESYKPRYRPSDLKSFARRLRAVENPETVLDDIKSGTLHKEGVEAIRDVYSAMYEDIAMKLAEGMSRSKSKIQYSKKVQLSLWFGQPMDPSMTPEAIRMSQGAFEQSQSQGKLPGGARASGLSGLKPDKKTSSLTMAQRLSGG